MARTQPRIPIARGIWRDGNALTAEVRIGSSRLKDQTRKTETFPLDTEITKIIAWQLRTRGELLDTRQPKAARGSLAADVAEYLRTIPDGQYRRDTAIILRHWETADVGSKPRREITRVDVQEQIARWITAGVAVSTVNKRLGRLRNLYGALDGPTTPNPTDKIEGMRGAEKDARDIPVPVIQLILDSMLDRGRAERGKPRPEFGVCKARLRVCAWTGITYVMLKRVRPRDLDLKQGRVFLRPRRKGKGIEFGAWIKLTPRAIDAFRSFAAANLFGRNYSGSSLGKTWQVGIERATAAARRIADDTGDRSLLDALDTLPPNCTPYDLRHSFLTEMYGITGDIRAVAELGQHASLETTKRYLKGKVSERVSMAIEKAGAIYAAVPVLPAPAAAPARRLRLVKQAAS